MKKGPLTLGLVLVFLVGLAFYLQTTMQQSTEKVGPYTLAYYEKNETEYVGDNSKVIGLIDQLPYARERKEVHIDAKGHGLQLIYNRNQGEIDEGELLFHQAILFQLIHNLNYVEYKWQDGLERITKEEMKTMYNWSGKRLEEEQFQQQIVQPIRNHQVKRKEG